MPPAFVTGSQSTIAQLPSPARSGSSQGRDEIGDPTFRRALTALR
jgi:hypothetical protein